MVVLRWIVLLAAVAALQGQQPVFRSVTDVVPVWVSVDDSFGSPLEDLDTADLAVTVGNAAVPIETVARGNTSLAMTVMVQTGYGRHGHAALPEPAVVEGVFAAIASQLADDDRVRLGSFGVETVLSPVDTSDGALLRLMASEEIWMRPGWNALWSGLFAGIDTVPQSPGRRVLLVIGDGVNSADGVRDGSTTLLGRTRGGATEASVLARALEAHVTVVALSLSSRKPAGLVARLAEETGGTATLLESGESERMVARMFGALRDYWLLGVRVPDTQRGVQKIVVSSRRAGVRVVSQRRALHHVPK
jgi:hypothetical protein